MLNHLKSNAIVLAISIPFFIATFAMATELYELSDRELVVALVASIVCGGTILVASLIAAHVPPFAFRKAGTAEQAP